MRLSTRLLSNATAGLGVVRPAVELGGVAGDRSVRLPRAEKAEA